MGYITTIDIGKIGTPVVAQQPYTCLLRVWSGSAPAHSTSLEASETKFLASICVSSNMITPGCFNNTRANRDNKKRWYYLQEASRAESGNVPR